MEGQGGLQVLVATAALLRMLMGRDLGQMSLQGLAAAGAPRRGVVVVAGLAAVVLAAAGCREHREWGVWE